MNAIKNPRTALTKCALLIGSKLLTIPVLVLAIGGSLVISQEALADTTITSGNSFTIDNSNSTQVGNLTTWNEAGTLTIHGGGSLQTWPTQNREVANNANIVFAGNSGTIALKFNGNDTHFTVNGAITSTATGAQTLAINTGNNGNGDRAAATIYAGIPNVNNGSPMSLQVTYKTQSGANSYVSLPGLSTFTGPITLVNTNAAAAYLTVGGVFYATNASSADTAGTGSLGGGNYPGNITLGAITNFNYLSSTNQTLSGQISGAGNVLVGGGGTVTLSGASTLSGNTTVKSGSTLALANGSNYTYYITNSAANKITGSGTATLNGTFNVDTSAVTATSGSWTLVDATSKSFGASFGLSGFTGPVSNIYTKTAAGQTWTFDKSSGVLSLSSAAIITSFGIPGSTGVINQTAKTISLTLPYTPWGTSGLASLAPTFTVTSGTCNQTSGSAPSPNFAAANPATYTVTDGATVNHYAVTITVTAASSACNMLACNFGVLGSATVSGTNAVLTVASSQSRNPLSPTFTLSPNATINPASGSSQNFTSSVTYRVTAENGTTFKDYAVSVQSYETWAHSGSLFILTTPDGANIPAGVTETNFPLLVRLDSGTFDFSEAQPDGGDVRFTTPAGASLPYQIEEWDTVNERASIWVKIPSITGNTSQEIKMYWGKIGVASESNGSAVFNAANGYASVIHMNETLTDVLGTVTPNDTGTTLATGTIGKGRNFTLGKGINCGESNTGFALGNGAHSTQAWFRTNAVNCDIVDWGVEGGGYNKVQIRVISPPKIYIDGNSASVVGNTALGPGQWHHVVNTYTPGSPNVTRIYVDGQFDNSANVSMNLPNLSRMYIGGWYNNYSFVGDIDEVRISKVARSANWIKLEYENQKPLQTLLGSLVQSGSTFAVAPASVTIDEGTSTTLTGQAGGAQKVYWIYKKDGQETVLATDQFSLDVSAGRVTGDQNYVIQFKGIYSGSVQTVDIPVTITEAIPDPLFTLTAPATWTGRDTITVTPNISNLAALQAAGVDDFNYTWAVNGVAVVKQITPGVLTLLRSQGSGPMNVSLTMDNGGSRIAVTKTITVQEPSSDTWVERTPLTNEKPVNFQFFARNPATNLGTIYYNGTQIGTPDTVYLKVYKTPSGGSETLDATYRQALVGGTYAFTAPVAAGLTSYRVVYGTTTGGTDTDVATVTNLLCGDAFIIEGQSNALATDNVEPNDPTTDPWIRSYGLTTGWGGAISKGGERQLGVWSWYLAKRQSAQNNMPVCFINGAVGGTRIDQHMPNPAGHGTAGSLYSIYANLYNRVTGARLTHGIRGVLWHQGEQDQGSGGPDGDYDYKFYEQYFVDMTAAWKQDFPNIQNYYVFQIWPSACGDTSRNDQLREVQRELSSLYSNMRMMSTVGIQPGSSCHYVAAGYQVFSDLIGPIIEQDVYGLFPSSVFTAANLKKAYFTTATQNEIAIEFDQNISWNSGALGLFFLDGVAGKVTSGSANGKVLKLQLNAPSTAATITYLKGNNWNGVQANILYGSNGITALTFADVSIGSALSSYGQWSANPAQGLTAGVNDGPMDDPDRDGIVNLLEFALGGNPMSSSRGILPAVSQPGAGILFQYDRSNLSRPPATTQVVEYGSDLVGWTPVTIPLTSSGLVTVTPGALSDHVTVAVPNLGPTVFARLKVSE